MKTYTMSTEDTTRDFFVDASVLDNPEPCDAIIREDGSIHASYPEWYEARYTYQGKHLPRGWKWVACLHGWNRIMRRYDCALAS